MKRGQATIELLLILVASLIALGVIFSLYSDQVNSSSIAREQSTARVTVDRIVNTANLLYASGAGSKSRILLEVPSSLNLAESGISGKEVNIVLSSGGEIISSADVNIVGDWKRENGGYIFGSYYANLYFDGNVVKLLYDDFEFSTESISLSAEQGTSTSSYFSIRNLSSLNAHFWVSDNFSHSSYATLSMCASCSDFVLANGESKVIDFNISLSSIANGNYSGVFDIIAELSDGESDTNYDKRIVVSVEAFQELGELIIYPQNTSFTADVTDVVEKSFSVCNSSGITIIGLTWGKYSSVDGNMLSWFDIPALDSNGDEITIVNAGDCVLFDLNFSIPIDAESGEYDANFFVEYGDSSFSFANISINVNYVAVPSYTVTYNGNGNTGGSVPVDSNVYDSGDMVVVLDNTGSLVKTSYTFDGWNTAANGSGTDYNGGSSFEIDSNVVLYAQWVPSGGDPYQ